MATNIHLLSGADDSCDVNGKKPKSIWSFCERFFAKRFWDQQPLPASSDPDRKPSVVPDDSLTDSSASAATSFLASQSCDRKNKQYVVQLIDFC